MSATPPTTQCRRNECANMIVTVGGKKYCSDKCGRNAAANRRRARADTPLDAAVKASTDFTMKKLKLSAKYLAGVYKIDVDEAHEMLIEDMERRFLSFWDEELPEEPTK